MTGSTSRAHGQIDSALLSQIPFNLTNPGGKSLAMGGAFTAVADDATAAVANPAGLGLLSSVEAGVSFKRFDETTGLVTARSTATGQGFLVPYPPVTASNSEISSTLSSVEFIGVVLPVSRRFVLAVSYSENLRFRADPGPGGYSYIELRDNRVGGQTRRDFVYEYKEFGAVALENKTYSVSAAFRVTERFRLGFGLGTNRAEFSLEGDAAGAHRIVNRTYRSLTDIETKTTFEEVKEFHGNPLSYTLGFQLDLAKNSGLTVGAAYRSSRSYEGTLALSGNIPAALRDTPERTFEFAVPPDLAAGLALQPMDGLTIALEGQWIFYQQMWSTSLPITSYDGLAGPSPGFPISGQLAELSQPSTGFIPRVGLEYLASTPKLVLAFRLGYHREPARGVSADLYVTDASSQKYDITDPPMSESVRTVYNGGKPDDRFSGGVGATLRPSLSIDLAFDVGRQSRRLAVSAFYRF
ncbi:MAG: outer membrane protein transport protein [Acidobacteria bacterium]|nr:outer membrane protein transport protein [Acidobacteriota bacterium]